MSYLAENEHWWGSLLQTFEQINNLCLFFHILHFLEDIQVRRSSTSHVHLLIDVYLLMQGGKKRDDGENGGVGIIF